MDSVVTEFVNFQIHDNLPEADFTTIVNDLEEKFHMQLSGYIDCELIKGKQNNWCMVMHWETCDELKEASRRMMKEKSTEQFRNALIPGSVKISVFEQVLKWKV